ncbi:MAG: penicillin-binding transpeptidase domain-containing protein [Oscillospiraceae bacterium]
MKKVSGRAIFPLILAIVLLAGTVLLCVRYFAKADEWVTFSGSPHVYTGVNLDGGVVTDRDGTLLLDSTDGRTYSADAVTRTATMHLLGDRYGYIQAPLLGSFADDMIGFDKINGLYGAEGTEANAALTLSAAAQTAAYQALGNYHGTVGVYNYKTGEILCAVTSPSYDPDNMPDVDADTSGAYDGVYVNRFFQAAYTPGSIFKIVTLAAAIETVPDWENLTFTCEGKTIIGGQEIICEGVHGTITLKQALAHSCNVAFGELAGKVGTKALMEYAEKLGLSESFECDGIPVKAGTVDLKDADAGDLAWAGIGQYTDQVNALTFMRAMGRIAGGGTGAEPYLMAKITRGEKTAYEAKTETSSRALKAETAAKLTEYLRNNVATMYGDWQFGGLNVCAKSGTAEHEGETADAMFAGFCVDENCPLAFVVFVENGGSGSAVAAPIAAKVLQVCAAAINR